MTSQQLKRLQQVLTKIQLAGGELPHTSLTPLRDLAEPPKLNYQPFTAPILWSTFLPAETIASVQLEVNQRLLQLEEKCLQGFHNLIRSLASVEDVLPTSDGFVADRVRGHFEQLFAAQVERILETVHRKLDRGARQQHSKIGAFQSASTTLLEAAYSRTQAINNAETTRLAELSGLTHAQVRTWFQNKRNRARRAGRIASQSALQSRVTPQSQPAPRRVISSLPKRAAATVASVPTHDAPRPIWALPRHRATAQRQADHGSESLGGTQSDSPRSEPSSVSSLESNAGWNPFVPFPLNHNGLPTVVPGEPQVGGMEDFLTLDIPGLEDLNLDFSLPWQTTLDAQLFTESPLDIAPGQAASYFPASTSTSVDSTNPLSTDAAQGPDELANFLSGLQPQDSTDSTLARTPPWSSTDSSPKHISSGSTPTSEASAMSALSELFGGKQLEEADLQELLKIFQANHLITADVGSPSSNILPTVPEVDMDPPQTAPSLLEVVTTTPTSSRSVSPILPPISIAGSMEDRTLVEERILSPRKVSNEQIRAAFFGPTTLKVGGSEADVMVPVQDITVPVITRSCSGESLFAPDFGTLVVDDCWTDFLVDLDGMQAMEL